MRLWTIQTMAAWEALQQQGVLRGEKRFLWGVVMIRVMKCSGLMTGFASRWSAASGRARFQRPIRCGLGHSGKVVVNFARICVPGNTASWHPGGSPGA
jgi:hypothetical protein